MMGLYGAIRAEAEQFRVFANGAAVRSVPFAKVADANAFGVAYVPADRRKEGLLLPHSIDFNLLLPLFASQAPSVAGERRRPQSPNVWRSGSTFEATGGGQRRPVRRKPAEGRLIEMAGARAVGFALE